MTAEYNGHQPYINAGVEGEPRPNDDSELERAKVVYSPSSEHSVAEPLEV